MATTTEINKMDNTNMPKALCIGRIEGQNLIDLGITHENTIYPASYAHNDNTVVTYIREDAFAHLDWKKSSDEKPELTLEEESPRGDHFDRWTSRPCLVRTSWKTTQHDGRITDSRPFYHVYHYIRNCNGEGWDPDNRGFPVTGDHYTHWTYITDPQL